MVVTVKHKPKTHSISKAPIHLIMSSLQHQLRHQKSCNSKLPENKRLQYFLLVSFPYRLSSSDVA